MKVCGHGAGYSKNGSTVLEVIPQSVQISPSKNPQSCGYSIGRGDGFRVDGLETAQARARQAVDLRTQPAGQNSHVVGATSAWEQVWS